MVKKIIEWIANATRKAYKILYEQLISHCINKKKNQVFHDKNKFINTRFYYLRNCITNKKVKSQIRLKTKSQLFS